MGDDVAEVLAAHRWYEWAPGCSCGWRQTPYVDDESTALEWSTVHLPEVITPLLATARAQGAKQALRDAAEMVIGCDHVTAMNWCGICDQWLAALRDRADRLAADHTPPSEAL